MNKTLITRRSVIQGTLTGAALAGGLLPGGALAAAEPVADSAAGKVRGVVTDGIFTFKGIPYGASTAGANRFMPPQKPEKWDGIRDALHLGPQAPQNPNDWSPELQALWPKPVGGDPEPNSEDCLVLNVWTPGLKGKRPVMVWIHGGGYSFGSDGPYPGLNLAKFGDVVVVGINHRLNIFGYLYLGGIGGEKYAASGNAGMLDIVASLEWVRDNIKAFGGDPGNVTIFGQSGGAAKVTTLMAMPAAKGLFHRAIAQSDYALGVKAMPAADAAKVTEAVLAQLGLKPEELDMLQQLPMERLIAAMNLTKSVSKFGPVMDGGALPRDPFDPDAPDTSADVPLLIGTTATETTSLLLMTGGGPAMFDLDEAGVKARIVALGHLEPAAADALYALYAKDYPKASPARLFFLITSDKIFRAPSITIAERKAAQGKAATYMYLWKWETPVLDGKFGAPHTIELPFIFHDVDNKTNSDTGNSPERYTLQNQAAGAWVAFARTGNPNHKGLPHWPAYDAAKRATMIFDTPCAVIDDPGPGERIAMNAAAH